MSPYSKWGLHMSANSTISTIQIQERGLKTVKFKNKLIPVLFLLPGVLFTFIFRYYTMFSSFWISLHRYDVTNPPGEFVGFGNYKDMLVNPDFWKAWEVTFLFVLFSLLLHFWVPIVQALFLNEIVRGRGIFSSLYLLPTVIPAVANVIIWKWIFHPVYGLANKIVGFFGLPAQTWYSDPRLTIFCIVFPTIVGGGFSVLLYLSAIQGISRDVVEAAEIDGCSGFKRLFYITLPNIKFLMLIQLILMVIGTMQILDPVIQYTMGGPGFESASVAYFIYDKMQVRFDYGHATAIAFMLQIVIAVITGIQLKLDNQARE